MGGGRSREPRFLLDGLGHYILIRLGEFFGGDGTALAVGEQAVDGTPIVQEAAAEVFVLCAEADEGGTGLEEPAGLVDEAGLEGVEEFLVFGEVRFRLDGNCGGFRIFFGYDTVLDVVMRQIQRPGHRLGEGVGGDGVGQNDSATALVFAQGRFDVVFEEAALDDIAIAFECESCVCHGVETGLVPLVVVVTEVGSVAEAEAFKKQVCFVDA